MNLILILLKEDIPLYRYNNLDTLSSVHGNLDAVSILDNEKNY